MHRNKNTISAHNPHTICTETETNKQNNMQHREHNTEHTENSTAHSTEQRTEHNAQPQQNSAHNYRTYSFDFYHLQQYIKKLYNTAIYEYYTFCSPYQ